MFETILNIYFKIITFQTLHYYDLLGRRNQFLSLSHFVISLNKCDLITIFNNRVVSKSFFTVDKLTHNY